MQACSTSLVDTWGWGWGRGLGGEDCVFFNQLLSRKKPETGNNCFAQPFAWFRKLIFFMILFMKW